MQLKLSQLRARISAPITFHPMPKTPSNDVAMTMRARRPRLMAMLGVFAVLTTQGAAGRMGTG